MNRESAVCNALLHLAYEQLKDGLFEVASETFSAAHTFDANDVRAIRGRELAISQTNPGS